EVAEAYLQYLYSEEAQRIAARNYYRPSNPEIVREFADKFVDVELFRIDDVFGGWGKAQNDHFNDGGKFDSILESLTKRWGAGARLPSEGGGGMHDLFHGWQPGRQRAGSFRGHLIY